MPVSRLLSLYGILLTLLLCAAPVARAVDAKSGVDLTLTEAERLALAHAPVLERARADVAAAAERPAYEGRLPDPQLTLSAINVPTDSFSLSQDSMTMVGIGLRQVFPPGHTLRLRTERAQDELERERMRLDIARRTLLKQVRSAWLDLYFAEASQRLLAAQREVARRDLAAAEGRYRAAQESERSLLEARAELARLEERAATRRAEEAQLRAQLARWIGAASAAPLPASLPQLPPPADGFDPLQHPEWRADEAAVTAAHADVNIARQEYKPGIMVDVMYGVRQNAPDMVTAQVSFDLPIFPKNRQDRRLAQQIAQESAAQYDADDKRSELQATYNAVRAEYDADDTRVRIAEEQVLPNLKRQAELTASGFRRDQVDLREARMKELDAEIDLLRLRVERAKAQAELLYLTGENPS
ncbi:MAG: TolC family protein [Acidiferrobacterales bacterium]